MKRTSKLKENADLVKRFNKLYDGKERLSVKTTFVYCIQYLYTPDPHLYLLHKN